jgi:hypothetical protein
VTFIPKPCEHLPLTSLLTLSVPLVLFWLLVGLSQSSILSYDITERVETQSLGIILRDQSVVYFEKRIDQQFSASSIIPSLSSTGGSYISTTTIQTIGPTQHPL